MSDVLPPVLPDSAGDGAWLRYLAELGSLAALRPLDPPRRVLLGLPTGDVAAAVLAAAALRALGSYRSTNPLDRVGPDHVGGCVSTFQSGAYEDGRLDEAAGDIVRVGTTKHTTYADVVRALPEEFPFDRGRRKLRDTIVEAWELFANGRVDARRLHARVSASPVLVIGHRTAFDDDIATLQELWPKLPALADVGHGLDGWFRHPIIVCSPVTPPPSWLRDVTPALVVCDGAAAWRSPLRRSFQEAAHLLVLDRRSQAAIDEIESIVDAHTETAPLLRESPPGIEAWRIVEHLDDVLDVDADEDLF